MKKVLLFILLAFMGNYSFGQTFTGAPLGLLINNTSTCEVYVTLSGRVTTIPGSVCGDVYTNTFHLVPSPGTPTYYTPSWDATNMFYSGGTLSASDQVSFERADFQFANCSCGSAGADMGVGCGASGPTWSNGCIMGSFNIPATPFSGPLVVVF